ncbi:hypothetical protein G8764_06010 [Pseudomaricurvus alcaniphilus]|nr:hypothetical protein [Pseudomaricurvus alcaniphilus]
MRSLLITSAFSCFGLGIATSTVAPISDQLRGFQEGIGKLAETASTGMSKIHVSE